MIHQQVEFHNVAELREVDSLPGLRLQRVPEKVRLCLNEMAQFQMLSPAGAEIRFVSESPTVRITLSCPEGAADIIPFWGLFQSPERHTVGPEPVTLSFAYPEQLAAVDAAIGDKMAFSPRVWRFTLSGSAVHFHGIEGEGLRPPTPEELPKLRYLAYGTSITHGACASAMHIAYANQTARRLDADLINLGVGGSAFCERELSDYIASRDDWDIASLALSVNMLGFTLEDFAKAVSYMVNTVAGSNTKRPVACITLFTFFPDVCPSMEPHNDDVKIGRFRQALRDAVADCPHPNVHLIEGTDILTDFGGLTPDILHPADHGMIQMGENLARKLKEIIG